MFRSKFRIVALVYGSGRETLFPCYNPFLMDCGIISMFNVI